MSGEVVAVSEGGVVVVFLVVANARHEGNMSSEGFS